MIAEGSQEQLERFALHEMLIRNVIDHQMGKVGLVRDRAQAGEFRAGKAHQVVAPGPRMWVGDSFQFRLFRRLRYRDAVA